MVKTFLQANYFEAKCDPQLHNQRPKIEKSLSNYGAQLPKMNRPFC